MLAEILRTSNFASRSKGGVYALCRPFVECDMDRDEQIFGHHGFQCLPGLFVVWLEQEKQMVESGLQEDPKIFPFGEFQPIAEQPADLTVAFGMGNERWQILTQCRFAASKRDM